MCQRGRQYGRENRSFPPQVSGNCLPAGTSCLSSILLLSLVVLAGCTSSGTSRRTLSLKSLRTAKSISKSVPSESSAGELSLAETEQATPKSVSTIRLIANEAADPPEPTPSEIDRAESDIDDQMTPRNSTASSYGITLVELEGLALANNPTLVQAQAAVFSGQGLYEQAGLYPNPQLGYLNGSASSPGVKESNGVFYSQEFPTANKLQLAQDSATAEIQRSQWDTEAQRKRVLNDLKIRYYEVLGAQESLAVAEKILATAEPIAKKTEELMDAGDLNRGDYLQARRHLHMAELSRDEAKDRYLAAWEQMAAMVGCSPMQPVPILDTLDANIPQLELESSWQMLIANSPQLRSTESELGHAWALYREAQAQAVPNFTVQIVSEYDRVTNATTVGTLLAMPVPIFNQNQGNIDKSAADIHSADAEIRRVRLVLRDQLAESFRRYKSDLAKVQKFKSSILPDEQETVELTQRQYDSREIGLVPVLTAQHDYSKSQVEYVETLTELRKVIVEIEGMLLTGGLNPASIGSALQNAPGGSQRQRAILNEAQNRNSKQLMNSAQIGQ